MTTSKERSRLKWWWIRWNQAIPISQNITDTTKLTDCRIHLMGFFDIPRCTRIWRQSFLIILSLLSFFIHASRLPPSPPFGRLLLFVIRRSGRFPSTTQGSFFVVQCLVKFDFWNAVDQRSARWFGRGRRGGPNVVLTRWLVWKIDEYKESVNWRRGGR